MVIPAAGHNRENDWRRSLAAAISTATGIVAVVVVSRRLSGHFSDSLPAGSTIFIAAILTALNMLAAGLLQAAIGKSDRGRLSHWSAPLVIALATLVPPLLVALAISQAGSIVTRFSLAALFVAAAVVMLIARDVFTFPTSLSARESGPDNWDQPAKTRLSTDTLGASLIELSDEFEQRDSLPQQAADTSFRNGQPTASQWMSRSDRTDGSERIEGTATLRFSPGQQTACIHVPFFPPLGHTPSVTCHLLEDCPVRLRVTFTQPYGTRVEAKRMSETSEAEVVVIGYLAVTEATRSKVA